MKNIQGTHVEVKLRGREPSRCLKNILDIINRSKLSKKVRVQSSKIFHRLAEAEAKVHGVPVNKVHFHEVGAVDAIIDIVGSCLCLEKLGIEKVFCSPLPFGKGTIQHAHGTLPNPAPATVELLKGWPVYGTDLKGELVTPTGAAIISTLATCLSDLPRLRLKATGCGWGSRKLKTPNALRVYLGQAELPTQRDAVLQIEANLDDLNPAYYDRAIKKIMAAGALDASLAPLRMKKQRRAVQLTVLTKPEYRAQVLNEIFKETTTLGVRIFLVGREKLQRRFSKSGQVKVKLGLLANKVYTAAVEPDDYYRLMKKHRVPSAAIYPA